MALTPAWTKVATVEDNLYGFENVIYLRTQLALQIICYFLQTGTTPHDRPSQSTRRHGKIQVGCKQGGKLQQS